MATATFWKATALTVNNTSSLITVQTGDSIDGIYPNSMLKTSNYSEPVEIKRAYMNGAVPTIELFANWPGFNASNVSATIIPSAAAVAAVRAQLSELINLYEPLASNASAIPAADSLVLRTAAGRIKAAASEDIDDVVIKSELTTVSTAVQVLVDIKPPATVQTLDDALALCAAGKVAVGDKVQTAEYNAGTGIGGNTYQLLDGTHTADGGSIISVTVGNLYLNSTFADKIDVSKFGVMPDIDCSTEMLEAFKFAVSRVTQPLGIQGSLNKTVNTVLFFPSIVGTYLFGTPKCMMDTSFLPTRVVGLKYEGGSAGCHIHFTYDSVDTIGYLFSNEDKLIGTKFENLTFSANSDKARFMYSYSDGGTQNPTFERVRWVGLWSQGFNLRGTDTNSEMIFDECTINAYIDDTFIDSDDVSNSSIPSTMVSDQFLNYWFTKCRLWLLTGQLLRSNAGGHYKFLFCDWSGMVPTVPTYMFELKGRTHARGVCDFRIIGGRFEHKNDNSLLMYCEWNQGTVFIDADCTSSLYDDSSTVAVVFDRASAQGPAVEFKGSYDGVHKYISATNGWEYDARAVYTGVQTIHDDINDFIKLESATDGSDWRIECDGVQSRQKQTTQQLVMNATIGGKKGRGSSIQKRLVKFGTGQGKGTPISTNAGVFNIRMPANAFITQVIWHNSGVLTSSASVSFEVQDGLGGTISTKAGTLGDAWHTAENVGYQLDSTKNVIKLVDTTGLADQQNENVWVAVEYIFG